MALLVRLADTVRSNTARLALAGAALLAIPALPAGAATAEGAFSVRGLGAASCGDLIANLQDEANVQTVAEWTGHWVSGYLTHVNRSVSGIFEVMPFTDVTVIVQLLANICADNPESLVVEATAALVDAMRPAWQTVASDLGVQTNGELQTTIRRQVLIMVQQALIGQGLLSGTADGVYGPATRTALTAYQQTNELPVTGLPDATTIVQLLLVSPAP